jgi:hypothetical protein
MAVLPRLVAPVLMLCIAGSATAQGLKSIEGSWILESSINEVDGLKTDQFGPNPKGMLMFGAGGRFMLTIIGAGLPKFASSNRANGTAEESKAVVSRSVAMIGSYVVDAGGSSVTFLTESATFPNWDGTEQRRTIVTLNADEFKYITATASGGGRGTVTWRRAH